MVNIAELDLFVDEYHSSHRTDVAITGKPLKYSDKYKVEMFGTIMTGCRVEVRRILDFGPGIGNSAPELTPEFFPWLS